MTAATKTHSAKTTPAKEPKKDDDPQPSNLREAVLLGTVRLVRQRKNGTLRSLPYPAPGSAQRKEAEAVAARRSRGEITNAIAEELNSSVATVRRMITNLELAQAIKAGEHADKWTPARRRSSFPSWAKTPPDAVPTSNDRAGPGG